MDRDRLGATIFIRSPEECPIGKHGNDGDDVWSYAREAKYEMTLLIADCYG